MHKCSTKLPTRGSALWPCSHQGLCPGTPPSSPTDNFWICPWCKARATIASNVTWLQVLVTSSQRTVRTTSSRVWRNMKMTWSRVWRHGNVLWRHVTADVRDAVKTCSNSTRELAIATHGDDRCPWRHRNVPWRHRELCSRPHRQTERQ